jgi:hypothetical protein
VVELFVTERLSEVTLEDTRDETVVVAKVEVPVTTKSPVVVEFHTIRSVIEAKVERRDEKNPVVEVLLVETRLLVNRLLDTDTFVAEALLRYAWPDEVRLVVEAFVAVTDVTETFGLRAMVDVEEKRIFAPAVRYDTGELKKEFQLVDDAVSGME